MQLLYIAAFASICVLFATVFTVMRSVREDDSNENMEAETALSFMGAHEAEVASGQSWRESAAALALPEPEREAMPAAARQPMFAQGYAPDAAIQGNHGSQGQKRRRPPAYAVVLQGMVVGAAIVLLTQTQKRILR